MVSVPPVVAVSGSDGDDPDLSPHALRVAEEVGLHLARQGAILVCGGKTGVMEAACRGASRAGGVTVGILPRDRGEANRYVQVPLATHLGTTRNFLLVQMADAVIGVAGRWGTLSEVAFSLNLDKRTIVIRGTGGWSDLIGVYGSRFAVRPLVAADAREAVRLAL
ncbi:MAG: TIGR00725 family protein, partial [Euryarchaeota archaeon]|nr:TIGR00725 family protein [Euryarchaeota archaeon]